MLKLKRGSGGTNVRGLQELIQWLPLASVCMAEVGSYAGESALIFAASDKIEKIFCVDHWNENAGWVGVGLREAEEHFDSTTANNPKITKWKMDSVVAAIGVAAASLDFVYIDASHDYESVKRDIELWLPKIKPGGVIGGHDFSYHFPSVIKAVGEAFRKPEHVFCDSSWVVKL